MKEIDEKHLVVNGNHRVMATKTFGLCEIPVNWDHKSDQEMAPYRNALHEHLIYKGYENFPLTSSSETRRKEIKQQMEDIIPSTTENILKEIQEKEDNIGDTKNNC